MTTGPTAARSPRSPAAYWRGRLSPWRTRRLLEAHLLVVFLLAGVASTTLFLSCRQVQHSAEALASREAPAVQGLAATRLAALRADQEVDDLVRRKLIGVAGSGETYRSQLSAADQGLSSIADRTDQDLGTVVLIAVLVVAVAMVLSGLTGPWPWCPGSRTSWSRWRPASSSAGSP